MVKKKERKIRYLISPTILFIFAFVLFVGGILILIYLISYPQVLGIIGLLGCFYSSFFCLIHALSFIQVPWAMRLAMNPFFRIPIWG